MAILLPSTPSHLRMKIHVFRKKTVYPCFMILSKERIYCIVAINETCIFQRTHEL